LVSQACSPVAEYTFSQLPGNSLCFVPDFGVSILTLAEHRIKSTLAFTLFTQAVTLFFILTSLFPSGTVTNSIPRKQP
jgi:multisubunit Na+/H+ antiporter MnhC subunit